MKQVYITEETNCEADHEIVVFSADAGEMPYHLPMHPTNRTLHLFNISNGTGFDAKIISPNNNYQIDSIMFPGLQQGFLLPEGCGAIMHFCPAASRWILVSYTKCNPCPPPKR